MGTPSLGTKLAQVVPCKRMRRRRGWKRCTKHGRRVRRDQCHEVVPWPLDASVSGTPVATCGTVSVCTVLCARDQERMDSSTRHGERLSPRSREGFWSTVLTLAPAVVALCAIAAESSLRAIDCLPRSELSRWMARAVFDVPTFTRCTVSRRGASSREVVTTCRRDDLLVPLRWTQVVIVGTSPQRVKSERTEIDVAGVRFFPQTPVAPACVLTEDGRLVSEGRAMTLARVEDIMLVRCGRTTGPTLPTDWVLGLRQRPSRWSYWFVRMGTFLAVLAAVLAWVRRDDPWALPWRIATLDAGGSYRLSCGTPVDHDWPGNPPEVLVLVDDDREGHYRKGTMARASRAETPRSLEAVSDRFARRQRVTAWGLGMLACTLAVMAYGLR